MVEQPVAKGGLSDQERRNTSLGYALKQEHKRRPDTSLEPKDWYGIMKLGACDQYLCGNLHRVTPRHTTPQLAPDSSQAAPKISPKRPFSVHFRLKFEFSLQGGISGRPRGTIASCRVRFYCPFYLIRLPIDSDLPLNKQANREIERASPEPALHHSHFSFFPGRDQAPLRAGQPEHPTQHHHGHCHDKNI